MMTTFAALGDSITLGVGDPAPGGGWRGWCSPGPAPQPPVLPALQPPEPVPVQGGPGPQIGMPEAGMPEAGVPEIGHAP